MASAAAETSFKRFTSQLFRHLLRADQHRWAQTYLAGLLVTPGKKSIPRLARSVGSSPSTAHALRQFINVSPWDWKPALQEIAAWAQEESSRACAWSIGRSLQPKRGEQSVGVHPYTDPVSGRIFNCQVALGMFLTIGATPVPTNWRLFLPRSWANDPTRRKRTRIPDTEHHRPLYKHALELVDSQAQHSASVPIVLDMRHDPDVRLLLPALRRRGHRMVIAVPPTLKVRPDDPVREPVPGVVNARTCVATGPVSEVLVPVGPEGVLRRKRVRSVPVRLPRQQVDPADNEPYRLFGECGPDGGPLSLWVTTFPRHKLAHAASLTALARCTASVISDMEDSVGLIDFEGRSYPGWYHHMTLASAAYAYSRLVCGATSGGS
ncbi:IS701 family transposase [Streptomyces ziwulingensis]|uniref:IS701 family transposase n=1 Tax=Streptomyces ziwulingensis TaxID=1045501 RepID=A0ABP9CTI3_9ACTN